ncbi:MAG: hypothetical protein OXG44_10655 [Gammaproteobacteria bacterium]|nr:hypothetical protein [Gammaproteobacteria bacterium]
MKYLITRRGRSEIVEAPSIFDALPSGTVIERHTLSDGCTREAVSGYAARTERGPLDVVEAVEYPDE